MISQWAYRTKILPYDWSINFRQESDWSINFRQESDWSINFRQESDGSIALSLDRISVLVRIDILIRYILSKTSLDIFEC